MDRCEDVQPSLRTGKVYVACTNNTDRGKAGKEGATEMNPRTTNRDGHIVEVIEDGGDLRSTTFTWNLLLVAGDPAKNEGTYFAGFPKDKVSPISCPDNVAFDIPDEHDPDLGSLPGHTILIVQEGIHIIESLYLEELAADGVREFGFVCLPLKLRGGTGSPVRPIALV